MNSFIKTLLILLLVYYGLKIIFRLTKPYLVNYFIKKTNERFGQSFGGNPYNTSNNPENEGKVTIDKEPSNTKQSNPNVGEYVDYEEIE